MRVVMTPAYFHPHVGGIETHSLTLARGLVAKGHEVHVITSKEPVTAPYEEEVDGIQVSRLPSAVTIYNAPLLRGLTRALRGMDADIVHAHLPSPYIACATVAAARLRGIPSVLTYHNDIVAHGGLYSLLAGAYNATLGKTLLNNVGRIICTSEGYARSSQYLARYLEKVVAVVNGVDTDFFHPAADGSTIQGRFGSRIVLFVGSLAHTHSYKGVEHLIRAGRYIRAAVPEARIVVVGDGPLKPFLQQVAQRQGVANMVTFVGQVPREDLPSYYAAATVKVLPSVTRAEGFGLVLLEAMASGKPVVGTTVGGVPYFVRDGETGLLVPPRNPRAIADAVIRILSDESLARELGARGRRLVEREFCWRTMVDRTVDVYGQALA